MLKLKMYKMIQTIHTHRSQMYLLQSHFCSCATGSKLHLQKGSKGERNDGEE